MSDKNINNQDAYELPIIWSDDPTIITRHVTNMIVQHNPEGEFVISFFELLTPIVIGTPEEQKTRLESIDTAEAKLVSRIVVSANRMSRFIEALQSNFNKYQGTIEELE